MRYFMRSKNRGPREGVLYLGDFFSVACCHFPLERGGGVGYFIRSQNPEAHRWVHYFGGGISFGEGVDLPPWSPRGSTTFSQKDPGPLQEWKMRTRLGFANQLAGGGGAKGNDFCKHGNHLPREIGRRWVGIGGRPLPSPPGFPASPRVPATMSLCGVPGPPPIRTLSPHGCCACMRADSVFLASPVIENPVGRTMLQFGLQFEDLYNFGI